MTEVVVDNAEQDNSSHAQAHQASTSAGQLLRQAREAKQMSVESLASALKVPVYKLKALEEDRWDQLTDSVFTRSLALSVCRVLRISSEPVLALLPKLQGAKLSTNPEGINAPFKEKSLRSIMAPSQETASGKAVKAAVAVLIAIAGGAGLYFLPQWQPAQDADVAQTQVGNTDDVVAAQASLFTPSTNASAPAESVTPALESAPVVAAAAVAAQTEAMVEPALKEVDIFAPTTQLAAAVAEPAVGAATTQETSVSAAAQSKPAEPEVAPVTPEQAPAPAGASMRFAATGETWVQVKDAKQRVVMEKILKAGDVYEQTVASRPLQVVVGNTGVTKLEIDGVTWDLAASAKNNVARFEVK